MEEDTLSVEEASPAKKKQRTETCDGAAASSQPDDTTACCLQDHPLFRSARAFILDTLGRDHDAAGNEERWKNLDLGWKGDREIALIAISNNLSKFDDLPKNLQRDRAFLLQATQRNSHLWSFLPDVFKDDLEFARAVASEERAVDTSIVDAVLGRLLHLRSDVLFWQNLAGSSYLSRGSGCLDLFEFQADSAIRSNREIMLRACKTSPVCFRCVDMSLRRDRDFLLACFAVMDPDHFFYLDSKTLLGCVPSELRLDVEVMLAACCYRAELLGFLDPSLFHQRAFVEGVVKMKSDNNHQTLTYVPHEVQHLWPELVAEALKKNNFASCSTTLQYETKAKQVAPELWKDRQVALAWFKGGGIILEYLVDHVNFDWQEDREVFLLMAKHCETSLCLQAFQYLASYSLKQDKEFMVQAVEYNACLYETAAIGLKSDFDIVVAALAGVGTVQHRMFSYNENSEFFEGIRGMVEEKLEYHASFTKLFLPAIRFGSTSTALTLPDQGSDTPTAKCIADFAGVPNGKKLRLLRLALDAIPPQEEKNEWSLSNCYPSTRGEERVVS